MASPVSTVSRIEEVDRKAKQLLIQLKKPGKNLKHEDLVALREELRSGALKEQIITECTDETKSKVNTEVLCSIISNFYELIECLDLKVSNLQKELSDLNNLVQDLKVQIKKLTKELEAQKGDYIQLMVGQLAFEVEKAIINEVLTEFIGPPCEHCVFTIAHMQKALERKANFADIFKDDSTLEKAKKKWEGLQQKLGWKNLHFRYIWHLKDSRVAVAHPEFEEAVVTKAIKEGKVDQYKEACTELLKMFKELQKNA